MIKLVMKQKQQWLQQQL